MITVSSQGQGSFRLTCDPNQLGGRPAEINWTPKYVKTSVGTIAYWYSHGMIVDIANDLSSSVDILCASTDTLLWRGKKTKEPERIAKAGVFDLIVRVTPCGASPEEHRISIFDENEVLVTLPDGALGDTIGWFGYVDRFQKKYNVKTVCAVPEWFIPLVKDYYPNIELITCKDGESRKAFARIQIGLFFGGDTVRQQIDFRLTGNHTTAGHLLQVDPSDVKCKFNLSAPRKIKEKYVCIASQGSSKTKCWNNPFGWYEVIKYLKSVGYRVLCIDKSPVCGEGLNTNIMPPGAEDFTGPLPLQERIDLIKDADFFIGLSSGLSWLAWCCNVPVVMISGFTLPFNEFYTPYRVINYNGCTGCWNDMRENFDHHDYMWCPRHKGTDRQFECSRIISHKQVIDVIKTIPEFHPNTVNTEDKKETPEIIPASNIQEPVSVQVNPQNLVYTVDCLTV